MHQQLTMSGWTNRKQSNRLELGVVVNVRESQSKTIWVAGRTTGFSFDQAEL